MFNDDTFQVKTNGFQLTQNQMDKVKYLAENFQRNYHAEELKFQFIKLDNGYEGFAHCFSEGIPIRISAKKPHFSGTLIALIKGLKKESRRIKKTFFKALSANNSSPPTSPHLDIAG